MAPVYHPKVKVATKPQGHQYHLCSKGPVPIPRVFCVKSQGVKLDQIQGFNPDLSKGSITEFVDSLRFGSFKLVTVVHFDF